MSPVQRKHLVTLLTAIGITLVAFVLSWLVARPFGASMDTLLANSDKKDFNMTDFYNIVADSRPVRDLEKDVVVINISGAGRPEITDLLNILSVIEPGAVGIDVTFNRRRPGDTLLLQAIDALPRVVLAQGLKDVGDGRFAPDDNSWFFDSTRHKYHYGAVNLPSKFEGATIRNFPLWFTAEDGTRVPSFALAVSKLTSPNYNNPDLEDFLGKAGDYEPIDFPGHDFTIIDWRDVPDRPGDIEGKIVLVGDTGDASDVHMTPVSGRMSGVMIHAYALATLLHGRRYSKVPDLVNILLAGAICVLIVFLSLTLTAQIKGITLRIVQVLLLYLGLRIGYALFVDHRIIMDFSYLLLMIAFVFFACDIWNGGVYLFNKIKNKICQKKSANS